MTVTFETVNAPNNTGWRGMVETPDCRVLCTPTFTDQNPGPFSLTFGCATGSLLTIGTHHIVFRRDDLPNGTINPGTATVQLFINNLVFSQLFDNIPGLTGTYEEQTREFTVAEPGCNPPIGP